MQSTIALAGSVGSRGNSDRLQNPPSFGRVLRVLPNPSATGVISRSLGSIRGSLRAPSRDPQSPRSSVPKTVQKSRFLAPFWLEKKAKNRLFSDPCGAKSRGSGGAPPTHLILLRNQCCRYACLAAAARHTTAAPGEGRWLGGGLLRGWVDCGVPGASAGG